MNKPTVIIGASPKSDRYSYLATKKLKEHGHTVYPIGITEGDIEGTTILTHRAILNNVHTITLYINPSHQENWLPYLLTLKPQRIIFNPGTENPILYPILEENGIEYTEACTLVLLSLNQY
ncbi:MAG: CoA-binding protein [Bacteroidota bacterium]|jgi:predicted CoA-binding protein|nr:CoA-binding protein [Bacteroidota bacterium]MCA6443390.1 CoA-binding protein [Bacteroidota bacterium]